MKRKRESLANRTPAITTALSAVALLLCASHAHAAGSLLRVACEGADIGAEIAINGVFKGECPLDIQVNEGTVRLRLLKKVDASRERVFEQEFRIGDGVVKKVEAVLSAPRLNADAQRREDERIAAERAEAARREQARQLAQDAQRLRDEDAVQEGLRAVEARDAIAMLTLADRYANGNGVTQSAERAQEWYRRAATAGNAIAAFKLTDLYKRGSKRDVDGVLRLLALPVAGERQVNVAGEKAIRAFISSDRFFMVPGGTEKVAYSFQRGLGGALPKTTIEANCVRSDPAIFRSTAKPLSSEHGFVPQESVSVLGGLSWIETTVFGNRTARSEVMRLDTLYGQPFPLKPGKRFGMTFGWKADHTGDSMVTEHFDCGTQDAGEVTCLVQRGAYQAVSRYSWHEASGCFLRASDS